MPEEDSPLSSPTLGPLLYFSEKKALFLCYVNSFGVYKWKKLTRKNPPDNLKRNNGKHLLSGHYVSCKWRDLSLLWPSINLETRSWLPFRYCIFTLFLNVLVFYCWITNYSNIEAKSNKHSWSQSLRVHFSWVPLPQDLS